MQGLTIIVATGDAERFAAALTIASASAALGARTRLYLHEGAVAQLGSADLSDALALDVAIIACQTGLAAAGIDLSTLDRRIAAGGLVSLLAALDDDRLLTI